jgi:hypothetical protein
MILMTLLKCSEQHKTRNHLDSLLIRHSCLLYLV